MKARTWPSLGWPFVSRPSSRSSPDSGPTGMPSPEGSSSLSAVVMETVPSSARWTRTRKTGSGDVRRWGCDRPEGGLGVRLWRVQAIGLISWIRKNLHFSGAGSGKGSELRGLSAFATGTSGEAA